MVPEVCGAAARVSMRARGLHARAVVLAAVLGLRQGIREAEVAKKAGQEGQAQEAAGSADGADAASKPAGELLR